jgi:hypothetical protein
MMPRPIHIAGRAHALIVAVVCLLLGSLIPVGKAGAQVLPNPTDPNKDPDQGEPEADPPPRRQEPPRVLFPEFRPPWSAGLADLRKRALEDYGLTFGASYQQLFQQASVTAPGALYNTALGGWAAASVTWAAIDRGGSYEGTLVLRGAWRDSIGNNAVPAQFGVRDLGSIWSNYEFTSWDGHFRVEDLFWEQKLGDSFSFRVGNQIPTSIYNFFRFKDARTSFTSSPLAFNETIPYPTFGMGTSFRWNPVSSDPGMYVVGTLNDMNGDPAALGLDWSTFSLGQYFYGLEIGKNWLRNNGEFDHFHVDVFWASERSTRSPFTSPNKAGGGFKVHGEKQFDRLVTFANYTYNTAQGGGISATLSGQTAVAGLAYLRPFGVQGEIAIAGMWSQLLPDLVPPGLNRTNQYGMETYWNIGVTSNSTVAPGVQLIFDPVLNPKVNFVVVPSIKFRVTL